MGKLPAIIFIICGLGCIVGGLFFAYDTQKKIEIWMQVDGQVVDLYVRESYEDNPGGSHSFE